MEIFDARMTFYYVNVLNDTCFCLNSYTSGMPIFLKINDDFLFRW